MIGTMIPAVQFAGMLNPVSSLEGFGAFIGLTPPRLPLPDHQPGALNKALGFGDLEASFLALLPAVPAILGLSVALLRKQET